MDTTEKTLKKEVGNWVSGDRFWDRAVEMQTLEELLHDGAHVLLVAPRRVGKTSLMHEAARRLEDRYHCLFVDLQKGGSAADAVVELSLATRAVRGLWDRTREVFRSALGTVAGKVEEVELAEVSLKLRETLGANWQARAERLFDSLAKADREVVIFFDELPILVNRVLKGEGDVVTPRGRADADAFISFLRAMSLAHQGRIRMVVAGSIGLEPVLASAGLSATLNTFTALHLDPWEPQVAVEALWALGRGYDLVFEEGAAEAMVARLGSCVPHHVQMFFAYALEDARRRGVLRCSVEDVGHVYERRMLSSRGHAELSHMEERLKLVLTRADLPLAIDLLTEAAVAGALTVEAARLLAARHAVEDPGTSLRVTLGLLEHDGYLYRTGEGHRFLSGLLRDWWKARFQLTYRPPTDET